MITEAGQTGVSLTVILSAQAQLRRSGSFGGSEQQRSGLRNCSAAHRQSAACHFCQLEFASAGDRRRKFAGAVGRGLYPFAKTADNAVDAGDPRSSLEALYGSFSDYLAQYEAATDALIADGFLLSGFKDAYMQVARDNAAFFP